MTSPPAPDLADLLWRSADRHGARPAVVERDREVGYAALAARAGAVAEALRSAGLDPGARVALLLERGADAVAALFGVYASGATAVIANERLKPRQIEYLVGHSGAGILLTTAEVLGRLHRPPAIAARVLDLADVPAAGERPPRATSPGPAQIIYTSGSTGLPKGVVYGHRALARGVEIVAGYLGLDADDRIAGLLPLSSVYGLNQALCAARVGAALLVERSPVANQVVDALRARRATVLAGVPPLWLQLLGAPAFTAGPIASLRLLQNAGGHLPVEVVRRVRQAQPQARLFLQYGLTETFRSTFLPPGEVDRVPGSMGRAMPETDVLVLREDGTPCEVGETGELAHRGPTIADGYWRDPEGTARVFRADPRPGAAPGTVVFTGDLARRDADGFLHFVGRRDRMIKTMGFRVGPDEVLDVLHASGEITEATVDAEPDPERGERIVAWVVLAPAGDRGRLERFCRAELPRHMLPARFEVLPALPRLPGGKYDLAALRAPG